MSSRLPRWSWYLSRTLIMPVRTQYVSKYENGIPVTVYTLTEEGQALLKRW